MAKLKSKQRDVRADSSRDPLPEELDALVRPPLESLPVSIAETEGFDEPELLHLYPPFVEFYRVKPWKMLLATLPRFLDHSRDEPFEIEADGQVTRLSWLA